MSYIVDDIRVLLRIEVDLHCRAAAAALWFYDYLLTLDDEIQFVWRTRGWNLVQLLFLITRYLPIISMMCYMTEPFPSDLALGKCYLLFQMGEVTTFIVMAGTEALLLLRARALWNESRMLSLILTTVFVVVTAVISVCAALLFVPGVRDLCTFRTTDNAEKTRSRWFREPFWAIAAFELTVICTTLFHGYQLRTWSGRRSAGGLMRVLSEGNLLYACILFAISMVNAAFYFYSPSDSLSGLLSTFGFQCVFHGMMGSRITFELRRAGQCKGFDTMISDIQHEIPATTTESC
ncbi:hypothetical protein BJ138DRAFT_172582 [Hygrophoropsis aurantiaca]|uniref:Uncharacterized protein n=1 Tax=Hygrophoropsis aurantiaca TaxID=72124 RepID=A0ACB8APB0_9AGAM|nr:hypothetical protein BJ138DRAFT_172582 [Hygrophoropsis aurantiaca]